MLWAHIISHITSEYIIKNGEIGSKGSSDCNFPNSINDTQHTMSKLVFGRCFSLSWLLKQYNVHKSTILAALTIGSHERITVN